MLHLQLGRVHGEKGEFDDELKNYIDALEIMTKDGRTKDSATVLNNIGSLYFDTGELDRSIEYCKKALAVRREYPSNYSHDIDEYRVCLLPKIRL